METLRQFLNSLPVTDQEAFAARCGTTIGYLRKALSTKPSFDAELAISIERESHGAVTCEQLRPDVDWHFLRTSSR